MMMLTDWNLELLATIYVIGIPVWAFVIAYFDGGAADWKALASAFLWPLLLPHLVGQILRQII